MSDASILRHAVLSAALIGCAGAEAAVYRWTDESGQTVYSQTPPPSGDAVRMEKPAAPPDAADVDRERQELREQIERNYDREVEREQMRTEQAEAKRRRENRAQNCQAARQNLWTFENLGRRRVHTPDGEYLRLSEEQRESQIRKARAEIDDYCD